MEKFKPETKSELIALLERSTPVRQIDVSRVTDFSRLGEYFARHYDGGRNLEGIEEWDTSNATNMAAMFYNCNGFNRDIGRWNVSRVTNMGCMFANCFEFNQDISGWDVSSVSFMASMFWDCLEFNQDISGWDVSSATRMSCMMVGCKAFGHDLSGWDLSGVTDTDDIFAEIIMLSWDEAACAAAGDDDPMAPREPIPS